jgi:Zn-dependent protease with chaperone function
MMFQFRHFISMLLTIFIVAIPATIIPTTIARASDLFSFGDTPEYDTDKTKPFLKQIEDGRDFPKHPYQAPEKITSPYASSSLGPRVAYALINGKHFVEVPDVQAFAQSVVDRLLATWNGAKPSVRVWITGEPAYGAEAVPTGDILLSIGTFNPDAASGGIASVDELALLLGHELGHILLRHLDHIETMEKIVATTDLVSTGFTLAGTFSKPQLIGGTLQVTSDQRLIDISTVGGLAATTLLSDTLAPSWARAQEFDADKIGLDLALRAGYVVGEDEITAFVTKHSEDQARRTAEIDAMGATLKAFSNQSIPVVGNTGFLSQIFGPIGDRAIDGAMRRLAEGNKDHPTLGERVAALTTYSEKFYANTGETSDGSIIPRKIKELDPIRSASSFTETLHKVTQAFHVAQQILALSNALVGYSAQGERTAPPPFRRSFCHKSPCRKDHRRIPIRLLHRQPRGKTKRTTFRSPRRHRRSKFSPRIRPPSPGRFLGRCWNSRRSPIARRR